ncbi:MAG: hypothetical protein EAX96_07045 [Candidatus Lokiarchaeota archaeon]|nr:hypothetical protein [Candidatus Lokiarchaeota archaeon]
MKKSIFLIFLLIIPISIGLFIGLPSNLSTTSLEKTDINLDSLELGEVDQYINLATGAKRSLAYLNGYMWIVNYGENNISQCNIAQGSIVSTIVLSFQPYGITTDGTYLYVSVFDTDNGTIFKLSTDGSIISNITFSSKGLIRGLAWLDGYIWAYQNSPSRLFKIHPTTAAISANYTIETLYDITAYNGYVWCLAPSSDHIFAVNPTSGRIMESFRFTASYEYGLTHNGTNFIMGYYLDNDTLSVFNNPTQIGEIYNRFDLSLVNPKDITWNGTHYFVVDIYENLVSVIHDGSYENEYNFSLSFIPYGITRYGNYLLISAYASPYKIYKYTFDGTYVSEYAALGLQIDGLAYDGTHVWASFDEGSNSYIAKLSTTDFTEIERHVIEDAGGITYDNKNGVLWIVAWSTNKLVQYSLAGTATGVSVDSPQVSGEWGITFNGVHLIVTDATLDVAYKVIISLPSASTPTSPSIPGFELFFVLISMISLIGMVFIGKKMKGFHQKNSAKNIF